MAEGNSKTRQGKTGRYYIRGETVPFEEDMVHEFKGHRNLAVEELPPWTQESKTERASRKAASRTINAFLNTGKGGTVYLGIIDSGVIRGIQMTQYQKDHLSGSLDDLLSRYSPPVKSHRYKVKFVPVVDNDAEGQVLLQQGSLDASSSGSYSDRLRPHVFRSFNYCWCDKEAVARYNARFHDLKSRVLIAGGQNQIKLKHRWRKIIQDYFLFKPFAGLMESVPKELSI